MPLRRFARESDAFYGVYEPATRTIYANGVPSAAAGVDALLDAILQMDRRLHEAPPPPQPVRRKGAILAGIVNMRTVHMYPAEW